MEGQSSAGRVAEIQRSNLPNRLLKGAENLGAAWRAGQRCLSGFARICPCATPTDFCQIKLKWIALAEEYHNGPPFGLGGNEPFYVVEAMTRSQFSATKMTMSVELPSGEIIKIGFSGTNFKTLFDLAQIPDEERGAAIRSVLLIQKVMI